MVATLGLSCCRSKCHTDNVGHGHTDGHCVLGKPLDPVFSFALVDFLAIRCAIRVARWVTCLGLTIAQSASTGHFCTTCLGNEDIPVAECIVHVIVVIVPQEVIDGVLVVDIFLTGHIIVKLDFIGVADRVRTLIFCSGG